MVSSETSVDFHRATRDYNQGDCHIRSLRCKNYKTNKSLKFTIVYKSQNYWVWGLCPSSCILKTRERNVSETGSVSILR
jgi:hypothetical protein